MSDSHQDRPEIDPKELWQNQPLEDTAMTLEMIHRRARELRRRNRWELIANLATIPVVIAMSWFGLLHTHDLAYRSAFAGSLLWAILGQYLLYRAAWSAAARGRSASISGLEFYRREIDRRRNVLGRILQWSYGPTTFCVCTLILLLTGMGRSVGKPGAALPFTAVFVLWIVAALALRSRDQKELKQEMDSLTGIAKEGRSPKSA